MRAHGVASRCFLTAVSLIVTTGCGYHLVGMSSSLPADLQTLYVQQFDNNTSWADMDQRLVEEITQEWVRRGRFRIVNEQREADALLSGAILSLAVSPVSFDERGRATEYQMTLTTAVRLADIRGDEPAVLWEDKAFQRRTSYQVDVSAVDYFDRQVEAMDELSREYSRALVSAVLEGF